MQANDPDRCQKTIPGGQCTRPSVVGSDYCERHTNQNDELSHYVLTNKQLGEVARRHAGVAEIKSLRDEIAITRGMLEIMVNSLETPAEFMAAMPRVHASVMAIEKLVNTCHQMEVKLGDLLDKAALLSLAQSIINIIATNLEHVPNRDIVIETVSRQIVQAISQQENSDAR